MKSKKSCKRNILLIELGAQLSSGIKAELELNNYHCVCLDTRKEVSDYMLIGNCNLFIIDMQKKSISEIEFCKKLRSHYEVPIIVISHVDDLNMKLEAFNAGANDYLIKPFSIKELVARIRSLFMLLDGLLSDDATIRVNNLEINPITKLVFFKNQIVPLTKTEFNLLYYFIRHPNRILSREQILGSLWHCSEDTTSNIIDVYIGNIRKKLTRIDNFDNLKTIRGLGYIFIIQ